MYIYSKKVNLKNLKCDIFITQAVINTIAKTRPGKFILLGGKKENEITHAIVVPSSLYKGCSQYNGTIPRSMVTLYKKFINYDIIPQIIVVNTDRIFYKRVSDCNITKHNASINAFRISIHLLLHSTRYKLKFTWSSQLGYVFTYNNVKHKYSWQKLKLKKK